MTPDQNAAVTLDALARRLVIVSDWLRTYYNVKCPEDLRPEVRDALDAITEAERRTSIAAVTIDRYIMKEAHE